MKKVSLIIQLFFITLVFSQAFTEVTSTGLPNVQRSAMSWGDYDNDGDLDVLLCGFTGSVYISRIYRNSAGSFADISAGLKAMGYGSAEWGDFDNDGDLDILLTGFDGSYYTKVYRNNSGTFAEVSAGLPGVLYGTGKWGDYDNDGDLDIFLTGNTNPTYISRIYRNDSGVFNDIGAGFPGLIYSAMNWGDYDNDGDLDVLLSGYTGSVIVSTIYRNDGNNIFTDTAGNFGVYLGSSEWGDFDNDGDLDFLLTGYTGSAWVSSVYRNDSGSFENIGATITGLSSGSSEWGDYDNDGDLDILVSGASDLGTFSKVYRNDSGTFTDISAGLFGLRWSAACWGDYNNDGDLDIFLTGNNPTPTTAYTKLYRNNCSTANTAPNSPPSLSSAVNGNDVTVSWNKATDSQTPQAGLSYNIYIGTSSLNVNSKSPMSNVSTGYRKIVNTGNVCQPNSYTIKNLPTGQYYWSVQAVDHAYAGSSFAGEQSFFAGTMPDPPGAPVALDASDFTYTSFKANWSSSSGADGYYLDVAVDESFTNYVTGFQNKNVLNVTTYNVPGLNAGTTYYYRLRAYNLSGTSGNGNTITTETLFQVFTEITGTSLPNLERSSVAWGDYDSDGDLDILISGGPNYVTNVFRNDGGTFVGLNDEFTDCGYGTLEWGDYDNDGDLDILSTGFNNGSYYAIIYRNNAGAFSNINAELPGVCYGAAKWGDYDNDGDLDLVITGNTGTEYISRIYRNDAGFFGDLDAGLPGLIYSMASWSDYDNDGDIDLCLTGYTGTVRITRIYSNNTGVFEDIEAGLSGAEYGYSAWGDYDNDGDPDLLLIGHDGSGTQSKIYRNDAGEFYDISAGLTGMYSGYCSWGDYDNDGDLDIMTSGYSGIEYYSQVYNNNGGDFTDISAGFPGLRWSSNAWGDYDNDGDLDLLLSGVNSGGARYTKLYRNNCRTANTIPAAPSNLSYSVNGSDVTVNWSKSTDSQTSQNGLSYNIYIGTSSQYADLKSPMSDISTGYRKVINIGNSNQAGSYTIKNLPDGLYYWSVQAVDHAYSGSAFAAEKTFFIGELSAPSNVNIISESSSITISWSEVSGATSYKIYACDEPYGTYADVSSQGTFSTTTNSWQGQFSEDKYFFVVTSLSVPAGFVFVQGGTFQMGDRSTVGDSDALPVHSVTLSSFYIGKYEVTQAEWAQYMPARTYNYGAGAAYPVYYVQGWYETMKYCNLRSIAEGLTPCYTINGSTDPAVWGTLILGYNTTWDAAVCNWSANGYRLPTEAEWEYAARGGIHNADSYNYSGSDTIDDVAWYYENSGIITHPVGTKAENQLGLYDMSGNVWEWCWDWKTSYTIDAQTNPTGPTTGFYRVSRGGFFASSDACECMVSYRSGFYPYYSTMKVGFRLARTP